MASFVCTCAFHYKRAVRNSLFEYPEEYLFTLEASRRWYPERSLFQLLSAIALGPRLAVTSIWHTGLKGSGDLFSLNLAWMVVARSLMWILYTFIPSSDDDDLHDICTILYVVLTTGWMAGIGRRMQVYKSKEFVIVFVACFFALSHCYIQYSMAQVAGAHSLYALFQWVLMAIDLTFDWVSTKALWSLDITINLPPLAPLSKKFLSHV